MPPPPPKNTPAELLEELVNLAKDDKSTRDKERTEMLDVNKQMLRALTGGGGPGGAGSGSSGAAFGTPPGFLGHLLHGPQTGALPAATYQNPNKGFRGFLDNIADNIWKRSRVRRAGITGGRIGVGIGRWIGRGVGRLFGASKSGQKKMGKATSVVGGAVGGLVGGAASVFGTLVSVVGAAIKAIRGLTDASLEEAKRLSAVSGSMAAVTATREMHQILRDLKKGEATAGTAQELEQAEEGRKQQENRIEIAVTNMANKLLAWGNELVTDILEPLADVVEAIAEEIGVGKDKVDAVGLGGLMTPAMIAQTEAMERGRRLMDIARAAGGGGPAPSPAGAAPLGRGPAVPLMDRP